LIVAYAILHGDPPEVFLATDEHVLAQVLAMQLVARTDPAQLPAEVVAELRRVLLEGQWSEAVLIWIQHTDTTIDIYPSEGVVHADSLGDADVVMAELQFLPLFGADEPQD